MKIQNDTILDELKKRISISAADEPKIGSFISQMVQKACIYCNISTLPDELFYTLVDMVEQRMGAGSIESIARGDTNIKYKTPDEIIFGFRTELNRFRRIKTL